MIILLYIAIITAGYLITKYDLTNVHIDKRIGVLQKCSLFFMLGLLGYKIGINKEVLDDFFKIGVESIVISVVTIICSVVVVHFLYKKNGDN